MIIRELEEKDLNAVSTICMESFLHSVAETVSDEGITTFSNIAAYDAFFDRMQGDNLMLAAQNGSNIEGIIELKEGRHVAMLFIRPDRQKNGTGRKLILSALNHATAETITVNSSLPSVAAYETYGFECTGAVSESAGLVYQPMALKIYPEKHTEST
ncbi:MAG: GNAT family N-acetyltransferase [Saccharospirillaceae bacterium]|nr:GNAT family N-acetyltransferase [Saccharospirillaceae bacterium]